MDKAEDQSAESEELHWYDMHDARVYALAALSTPTSAARPMQGLDCFIRKHINADGEESFQVQCLIGYGLFSICKPRADGLEALSLRRTFEDALREVIASEVEAVQAQPASAPMGEPIAWLPNSENINALPVPVREYIMHLETICDPAGLVRENAQLRDTNRGLQVMYRNAVDAAAPAQARMPLSEEEIVKIAERYDVQSTVNTYGEEIINFARAVEAAHGVGVEGQKR